jgi:tetratricopeptide (TPR) repeat protein
MGCGESQGIGRFRLLSSRVAAAVLVAAMAEMPAWAAVPLDGSLPLAATYGAGVHSYFAGDYARSYDDLSAVIQAGSQDPRPRYFRGLAALQLGRLDEAEADFSEGADLEARGTGAWPVAKALERIQGCDRLRLERHRVRARVATLQEARAAERRRYSEIEDAQADVLRRWRPTPAETRDPGNVFDEAPAGKLPAPEEIPQPTPEPMTEPAPAAEPAAEAPAAEAPTAEAPFGTAEQPQAEAAP